jgi:hypothetical protein
VTAHASRQPRALLLLSVRPSSSAVTDVIARGFVRLGGPRPGTRRRSDHPPDSPSPVRPSAFRQTYRIPGAKGTLGSTARRAAELRSEGHRLATPFFLTPTRFNGVDKAVIWCLGASCPAFNVTGKSCRPPSSSQL